MNTAHAPCATCARYRIPDDDARTSLRQFGFGQCSELSKAHWLPPHHPCRFTPSRHVPAMAVEATS